MRTSAALAIIFVLGAVAAVAISATKPASAKLAFAGVGEDKVGSTFSNTSPNGKPDGHFTFTIVAPGETVVDIELRTAKPDGSIFGPGGEHWDTIKGGWWLLGVFRDGTLLNPKDSLLNDPVTGAVTYELYAESTGHFVDGTTFRVDATFQSGRGVAAAIKIGSSSSFQVPAVPPSAENAPGAIATNTVPTTAPFQTSPIATTTPTSSGGSHPGSSTPATKLALALSPVATKARPGRCVALSVRLSGRAPSAAVTRLDQRAGASWRQVAARAAGARTAFSVCSKKVTRNAYRATIKAGASVLARSNTVSVTWK